jgi:hypothetical protein
MAVGDFLSMDDTAANGDSNIPNSLCPSPCRQKGVGGKRNETDKKHQVLNLANYGMSAEEIASRLDIPRGEIDLILNLKGNRFASGIQN